MITLITAVPGTGKTLFLLPLVEGERQRSKRQVFYSGINQLTLPWVQFGGDGPDPERPWETDASEWYKLPKGSIIVIDEAQRLFRNRSAGAHVPEFVAKLETHRHFGFDIYLVTQHANLLDVNVRRLVGRHLHLKRLWRTPFMVLRGQPGRAALHEWSECVSPINKAAIADAQRTEFFYPREYFKAYKSAYVHTHGRKMPARVVFLWCLPFVLVGLGYVFYNRISSLVHGDRVKQAVGLPAGSGAAEGAPGSDGKGAPKRGDYVMARAPRIASMPWTAPVYDKLTAVARVPVPAACVKSAKGCRCYTQDATPLQLGADMCEGIVAGGYFVDFDPDAGLHKREPLQRPVERPEARAVSREAVQQAVPVAVSAAGGYDPVSMTDHVNPVALSAPDNNEGVTRTPRLKTR
jgi:hypothetical protein